MNLTGKFARLRPIVEADAALTLKWRTSQRARYLQPGAVTVDQQRSWITTHLDADEYNWIIEYQDQPVGMIAIYDINKGHRSATIGRFLIGEEALVGQAPVGFEADLLVSDFAFDQLQLHRIHGPVMADNEAVIQTRLYLGYVQEGIAREHYIYDGEFKDAVMFGLLEDEYRRTCRPRLESLISLFGGIANG